MQDAAAQHTERVLFNSLKAQRRHALAEVIRLADVHGLRVDSIEQRPRRLSVDILLTVTGEESRINAFSDGAGGQREADLARRRRRSVAGAAKEILANLPLNWP